MDISSLIDSLHPLEVKVLSTFGANPSAVLQTEQLAQSTGLEPSQFSMAVEWLLAKSLLTVDTETVTPNVSLTKIGELYFEKYSPIERVLSVCSRCGQNRQASDHSGHSIPGGARTDGGERCDRAAQERGRAPHHSRRLYRIDRPTEPDGGNDARIAATASWGVS